MFKFLLRFYWTNCILLHQMMTGEAHQTHRYTMLYNGGQKISANYTSYGKFSKVRCAAACSSIKGCWVFTWDADFEECQLLNGLTSLISTVAARSSLRTYYITAIDGKTFTTTTIRTSWTGCKTDCESQGGRLYLPPDTTFSLIYRFVFSEPTWVGMYRLASNLTAWYNMDGKEVVERPAWLPSFPMYRTPTDFYVLSWNGFLGDEHDSLNYKGFCEIYP